MPTTTRPRPGTNIEKILDCLEHRLKTELTATAGAPTDGVVVDRRNDPRKLLLNIPAEVRDKALETGAGRVGAAKRRGSATLDQARSAREKVHRGIVKRSPGRHNKDVERDGRDE